MLLLVMIALSAAAAEVNSAVGTWKLNLRKSTFTNMPAPVAEMLIVSTDTETALKWSLTEAEADGKSYHQSFDGAIDGNYHAMTGSRMESTIAYARNPLGGLNWVVKDKNGITIETGTGALSSDGRTLHLKGTIKTAQGDASFDSVYDRVP